MSNFGGDLPDYLTSGLSILFVGINPGMRSAKVGHHYAGPSNRFWKLLFETELIPHRMSYHDDATLLDYGYGLTNLIAKPTTGIQDLAQTDFLEGRETLLAKIQHYQPALVAIMGISVARVLMAETSPSGSNKPFSSAPVQPGVQRQTVAGVRMFVLPNPSGRNAHYSYERMKELFRELKIVSCNRACERLM